MRRNTRKSVTLREVAALAGLDSATVSRALSGKGYMSQKTRDAALKAARELGFQPDLHAQKLAQGRSYDTVTLLSDNDLGVLSEQAFFIGHRLDELGFQVQMHPVPRWVSHFEKKQTALANTVRRQRPGAIICGSTLVPSAMDELQFFMQEGGAVIGYGNKTGLECDQVHFDLQHRAYLAARHLLELGHREIGFCVHGPVEQDSIELAGFSFAMAEFGASVEPEWIFGGGNYEEGGARLAQAFLSWAKKPTGLCIINDVSASAFIIALAQNGVSVPGDVSVVGFDDARAARYALVPLTSVSYPLEAIGRYVVEFTQSRLLSCEERNDEPPRIVTVHSEVVTRKSTAPYRPRGRSRGRSSTARSSAAKPKDPLLSTEVLLLPT